MFRDVVKKDVAFLQDPDGHLPLRLSDFCRRGDEPDHDHAINISHVQMAEISKKANNFQRVFDKSDVDDFEFDSS